MTLFAEISIAASCVIMLLLTNPVTSIAGMEAESAALCYQLTIAITCVKPIVWTMSFIPAYGMRAAGDVKFSMILSTASMWIFRVMLCIYLVNHYHMGPIAVWIGMFADWTVRAIVFTWRFHSRKWLNHHIV